MKEDEKKGLIQEGTHHLPLGWGNDCLADL